MIERWAVAVVVVAEFLATSLWFSTNGAGAALQAALALTTVDIGLLTNAVQAGFVAGTLLAGLTGLADRFRASRILFVSALVGAAANAAFAWFDLGLSVALVLRFVVGLALAGIYPLGMKLVMSWTRRDTGATLALLVGMLTLGTALPHAIRALSANLPWQVVVFAASLLALTGGLMVLALGDGPHLRSTSVARLRMGAAFEALRSPRFRASALGYWGHMWELYAFWTLVPFIVVGLTSAAPAIVSAISFAIIGAGALGCFAGGWLGPRIGKARVAGLALSVSGLACFAWPLVQALPSPVRLGLLLCWGVAVVADSPQFSSLSADYAPPESLGSALAFQNAIGFAITTVAIAVATPVFAGWGAWVGWLLLPGPVLGLLGLAPLLRRPSANRP
jgi:MFS family permease